MYVTVGLWIAVAICALAFAVSDIWQARQQRTAHGGSVGRSQMQFAIGMLIFAACAIAKAIQMLLSTNGW